MLRNMKKDTGKDCSKVQPKKPYQGENKFLFLFPDSNFASESDQSPYSLWENLQSLRIP